MLAANLSYIEERWLAAHDAIINLAQQCEQFDSDGITLYVNNSNHDAAGSFRRYEYVQADRVVSVLRENIPLGVITLKTVLKMALDEYFIRRAAGHCKANGEMILIVTDGEPQDRLAVSKAIVAATQRMDRDDELGIGFVQVGDDAIPRGFFTALDEDLQSLGAKFDIVHTQILATISPESVITFLLNVIHD